MTPQRTRRIATGGSYLVAAILAVGMCTALNAFTVAVLIDALSSAEPGLSENATQILTGWGGGIVGVIGAVVGYQAGASTASGVSAAVDTPQNETLPGSGSRGG